MEINDSIQIGYRHFDRNRASCCWTLNNVLSTAVCDEQHEDEVFIEKFHQNSIKLDLLLDFCCTRWKSHKFRPMSRTSGALFIKMLRQYLLHWYGLSKQCSIDVNQLQIIQSVKNCHKNETNMVYVFWIQSHYDALPRSLWAELARCPMNKYQ